MIDIAIVGGGPAGVTAGIYATRAGLSATLFEKMFIGGQISITSELENYPGFEKPVSGAEFAFSLDQQARNLGVSIVNEEVMGMELEGEVKKIVTAQNSYECRTVILASGASFRKLGAMGEEKFTGRGVSYCATCDGGFYKGKTVAVVGGGNNAVEEAIYLSGLAEKVYLIHRRDCFRASDAVVNKMKAKENIELILNTTVSEIVGEAKVEKLILSGEDASKELSVDGVFVAIGRVPDTGFIPKELLDGKGYLLADEKMRTKLPGVFAAGDAREKELRQVVTAVSDGALAATSAIDYLKE